MLPFQSLTGADSLGQGSVWDLDDVASEFTVQTSATVTPDAPSGGAWSISIELQGSLDGENWLPLQVDTIFNTSGGPSLGNPYSAPSQVAMACSPSSYSSGQSNPAVRYLCLNIFAASGMTSYAVDGWIARGASVA